jgi:protein gp37
MAGKSNIEWTDATWNPIVGCSIVSPGCTNCYAMKMAARIQKMNRTGGSNSKYVNHYDGTTKSVKGSSVWTGKLALAPDKLFLKPLSRRAPTTYFVNSMGDLFHEDCPDEWIDKVFAVMALSPQHTFQCLTKRAARMQSFMTAPDLPNRIAKTIDAIEVDRDHDPVERWATIPGYEGYEASSHGNVRSAKGALSTGMNEKFGREQVTLWNKGESRTWFVHALVLMAHRGLPPEGHEARHRNGAREDNRLANLIWGTRSENQNDKVRHGAIGGPQKLTLEQVTEIRSLRKVGAETQQSIADRYGVSRSLISMIESGDVWANPLPRWPLPNCWLGVSTERQQEADERIPLLLQTPAAVRFVSAEPLLGHIAFHALNLHTPMPSDALRGQRCVPEDSPEGYHNEPTAKLDWVIVGGESGPGARPMHPDWACSIRDWCKAAGVPYFFKQWGSFAPQSDQGEPDAYWASCGEIFADHPVHQGYCFGRNEMQRPRMMFHRPKGKNGRLLDGVEHNGMPGLRGG